MTDTVAATAVRMACVIEGRFFSAQAQTFHANVIFPADHVWQDSSPGWMKRTEGNEGNEVSSKA